MLIVADLMGNAFIIREMALQLRLLAAKNYVHLTLIVATFHTALDGTTANCAPNAISLTAEMQNTTHLGRRSDMVRDFRHVCLNRLISLHELEYASLICSLNFLIECQVNSECDSEHENCINGYCYRKSYIEKTITYLDSSKKFIAV